MGPMCADVTSNNSARIRAIERHLATFLTSDLLKQFWRDGFETTRQPSFRLNALRIPHNNDCDIPDGNTVRQLLEGFGLPSDTPIECCPYYPQARLLPTHTASAIRVDDQAHTLAPLRTGAVYFMSMSSMLPALALMAHQPPHLPNHHHHNHQQQQKQKHHGSRLRAQRYDDLKFVRAGNSPQVELDGNCRGSVASPAASRRALRVLDLCAAPGGKTALMAELMSNRGTLLAVDSSWPRLQRLQFNLGRLVPDSAQLEVTNPDQNLHRDSGQGRLKESGMYAGELGRIGGSSGRTAAPAGPWWRGGCVVAVHADGSRLRVDEHGLPLLHCKVGSGQNDVAADSNRSRNRNGRGRHTSTTKLGLQDDDQNDEGEVGVFDRVLVDAPCSGLGRLQLQRPSSYSRWDETHAARHPERQRRLLLRGAQLLRRGGSLLYSTCTIDPRENEAVVAWLLGRVAGLRLVEPRLSIPPTWGCVSAGSMGDDGAAATAGPDLTTSSSCPTQVPFLSCAQALPSPSIPLRQALEAHRPGCIYPALLDGSWWDEAFSSLRVRHVMSAKGPSKPLLSCLGIMARAMPWTSRDWLRSQIESYCVRVAPGPTYEGFFIAQFVKD